MIVSVKDVQRKEVVKAISAMLEMPSQYLGTPTYSYQIDSVIVDKEGLVHLDKAHEWVGQELLAKGLVLAPQEAVQESCYTVSIARSEISDRAIQNLNQLLTYKQQLLKKALMADEVKLIVRDDEVLFPWFTIKDSAEAEVYRTFVDKLIQVATKQHRFNHTNDVCPQNERYAFRCFLLRIGCIGSEYKQLRKVLLKPLAGNSAFKIPKCKSDGNEQSESAVLIESV